MIPFNKPFLTGKETEYIKQAVESSHISGNGDFTKKCQFFFEERYGFRKTLLTTSCTDALEMCALLLDIKEGDEIIIPSYTFVSTALAFVRQGAKVVFADSRPDHPGIDENLIENLITHKTKAIVPVHYAGIACDMNRIMKIAAKHDLFVVEDAAQAIDSYYLNPKSDIAHLTSHINNPRPLGSIGHLATFSFHETKNINAGEGGLLVINDERFVKRAEILWEKGTNRAEFFRGAVNKYGWVDIGSSFLPSELIAAYLWAQLENLDSIQNFRKNIWQTYFDALSGALDKSGIRVPVVPEYTTQNGHLFYLVCNDADQRTALMQYLKNNGIETVFHYLSLHNSLYYRGKHDGRMLANADRYTDTLVRLPLFSGLSVSETDYIIEKIKEFSR